MTDTEETEVEHSHEVGDVLQKFDSNLWKITKRMVDVDSGEALYQLREVDDPSFKEIVTASEVAVSFDKAELVTDGGQPEAGLHQHTRDIKNRFPEPLSYLLVELAEMNRDKWLEGESWRRETIGADDVMTYGLTENQRTWANQIAEQMGVSHDAYR